MVSSAAKAESSLVAYLEERPLPLVALVGCTDLHAALTSRQPAADEVHPRYLSLPEDTARLDHRSTGEDDSSLVLKRDWLYKHTHVAAPVVALWFEWDSETTPIPAILTRLESFRSRVRPSCKIVLVLVQRAGGAGGTGGPLASPVKDDERLTGMRKAAELDSRSVLTLVRLGSEDGATHFDEGSVKRLERALLEFALSYYKDETRGNKKARQQVTSRATAAQLLGRHHFKQAYYSEVRRDAASASKHWGSCYVALRELLRFVVSPPSEMDRSLVSLSEIKRVAEFVNRKLCLAAFGALRVAEACEVCAREPRD